MTGEGSRRTQAARSFLLALADLDESSLRALRQSIGKPLGADLAAYDVFNRVWRPLRRQYPLSRLACWQVAITYPWNPRPGGAGALGRAMRRLAGIGGDFERVKTRLTLLLGATGRDLDVRLLDTVRTLASAGIAVDWPRLLEDLSHWYAPGRPIQATWALAFLSA